MDQCAAALSDLMLTIFISCGNPTVISTLISVSESFRGVFSLVTDMILLLRLVWG